jgi:hypothetical protein
MKTTSLNPHLREFVEESNGLSGIFLQDSKYKPRHEAGYTWDDDEFVHHYDVLCWVVSHARSRVVPTATEINHRLMSELMDDESYKNAGKLRRKDFASNRIIVPASDVSNVYKKWEAASQRFAFLNYNRYDSRTGRIDYQGCPHCQAIWLHKVFMYIRPFEDGNARTARLIWAAHQIVGGDWPIEISAGRDLPMCVALADEYDEVLTLFTKKASLIRVSNDLDLMFTGDLPTDRICCGADHDLNLRDKYNDPLGSMSSKETVVVNGRTLLLPGDDIELDECVLSIDECVTSICDEKNNEIVNDKTECQNCSPRCEKC